MKRSAPGNTLRGLTSCALAFLVGCAPSSVAAPIVAAVPTAHETASAHDTASPTADPSLASPRNKEKNRCDVSSGFKEPEYVDVQRCVPRAEVQALVKRGELHPISVQARAADGDDDANPTSLYLRVEIAARDAEQRMRVSAVGRGGWPSYSGGPMRGFVTVERVYRNEVLPDAMMRCEPESGCRTDADSSGAWCTDMDLVPGLQALRIVAPDAPPLELRRPAQPPAIEAYFADSADGRVLVQIRADANPFPSATLMVSRLDDYMLQRIPITQRGKPDCFYDARGNSHHKASVAASVFMPFSVQRLGPVALSLPDAQTRPRFGPVNKTDFELLLQAHASWLDDRSARTWFQPNNWPAMNAHHSECPPRAATPARAVLDAVDLAGLELKGLQLQRASLHEVGLANADIDKSDFCGADLSDADLRRAHALTIVLQDATLDRVDARSADLWGSMNRSTWRAADLRNANLGGSLVEADFANANLSATRLYGNFSRANFHAARLDGAMLVDADLRSATGLTQAQLDSACADDKTHLPTGLHAAACD